MPSLHVYRKWMDVSNIVYCNRKELLSNALLHGYCMNNCTQFAYTFYYHYSLYIDFHVSNLSDYINVLKFEVKYNENIYNVPKVIKSIGNWFVSQKDIVPFLYVLIKISKRFFDIICSYSYLNFTSHHIFTTYT